MKISYAPLLPPFVIVWLIKTESIVIVKVQLSIRTKYKDLQFTVGLFFVILILKYI